MRVHYLQQVPFEALGSMEAYFINKGHQLNSTHLYLNQAFPQLGDFDWLVVLGGPMGVYDDVLHPWLSKEKLFIKSSINSGKIVLGVCLGAQLIADVLGSKVYRNSYREIGWFPIRVTEQTDQTILHGVFPQDLEVFHWHGDTFDIPESGVLLASSEACKNQGFIIGNRVVGLQFHLETTPDSAKALIKNCGNELDATTFVQDEPTILENTSRFSRINKVMTAVLDRLESNSI